MRSLYNASLSLYHSSQGMLIRDQQSLITMAILGPSAGTRLFSASMSTVQCWKYSLIKYSPFDYSVKPARSPSEPICAVVDTRDLLLTRQATEQEDYSCGEGRPCRNGRNPSSPYYVPINKTLGACCPKETGWCNYGPEVSRP